MFNNTNEQQFHLGLTYDDIIIMPAMSEILPKDTNLLSRFSRNITLQTPLVSAAMDTVTGSKTAIAMARGGGLGVVHKNLSIKEQARKIKTVKKSESGMITNPITASPEQTVGDVVEMMKRFNISGLPVLENSKLVGIVTGRDIRFEKNLARKVSEVMTKKVISTKLGTSFEQAIDIFQQHRIEKLPVLDDDGLTLMGMFTIRDIENARLYPHASKDERGQFQVAAAIGVGEDYLERADALLQAGAAALVVDTAHGHCRTVIEAIKNIKKQFSNYTFDLVGGNVATATATKALIEAGVDAVKVGIGPGSICTTRIISGIGVPQFTAVQNCARAAKESGVPIIADGGIKYSGDVVKALSAGASSVMIGSLFAGTEEAPGEMVIYQGKSYKTYRGMGSIGAMGKGSKDRYFQNDTHDRAKLVPEGIEGRVSYKGSLSDTLFQIVGGVRAAMGYVGAQKISDLQENAEFMRVSPAGLKESHAHDVFITREAPNYKRN